jgi:hypothetical protein
MTYYQCSEDGCNAVAVLKCASCDACFCIQHTYDKAKVDEHHGPWLLVDHAEHPDNLPPVYALLCDGPGPHDPPDGILGTTTVYGHLGHRCMAEACQP